MILSVITATLVVLLIAVVAILSYSLYKIKMEVKDIQNNRSKDLMLALLGPLLFPASLGQKPLDPEIMKKIIEDVEKKVKDAENVTKCDRSIFTKDKKDN